MSLEITSALIAGLVLGILIAEVLRSVSDRKKKPADLMEYFLPRRAELYREFLSDVVKTGVQLSTPQGDFADPHELHLICNRALYTLCPYAGINSLKAVIKLSEVCARYELNPALSATAFRCEFQFYLVDLLPAIRSDCLGENIDALVGFLRGSDAKNTDA